MSIRLCAVLLMCAATAAVFGAGFRYDTVRLGIVPGITAGGWGATSFGVRVMRAEIPIISLTARGERRFPFVATYLHDPQRFRLVRVSAELAARDLRQGAAHWRQGRILLVSLDRRGRRLRHLETEVGAVAGTADWRPVRLVVPVEPETARFRLVAYNAGESGRMMVRHLAVDGVAETVLFTSARILLIALWVVIAAWVLRPLLARRRWRMLPVVTVALGIVILVGSLAPQPGLSNLLQPVRNQMAGFATQLLAGVDGLLSRDKPGPAADFDSEIASVSAGRVADTAGGAGKSTVPGGKGPPGVATGGMSDSVRLRIARLGLGKAPLLPHFAAFMLLGLVAAAAFPAAARGNIAAGLAVFAIAGETLQLFSYTRSTELDDYAWNLAGIAAGLALAWMAQIVLRHGSRRFTG